MTTGRKLGFGFAVALLFLVVIGYIAYDNTAKTVVARERVVHAKAVVSTTEHLLAFLVEAETGQRGFMLTSDDSYLEPYRAALKKIQEATSDLERLFTNSPQQQRRLEQLKGHSRAKLDELDETIRVARASGAAVALELVKTNRGKRAMDDARTVIAEIHAEESTRLKEANAEADARAASTFQSILYGTGLAAVLLTLIAVAVIRSVTTPLRDAIHRLSSSSSEILAGTTQQASSAQEQAAAVAQTVTTVDEVAQTAEQAAQRIKAVSEAAQRSVDVSRKGRAAVEESISGMTSVKEQTEGLAEAVVSLAERAQTIGEIIATVNDIAEQTNLLALNAGIEAARAGEHGRGFSVVAGEVRALADQSKKATAQVRQLLGEIQRATSTAVTAAEDATKSVNGGIKIVSQAGDTIRLLSETISEAAQASAQIAASAGQQATGMLQIHQAMKSINLAASQSLASTKQAERAAQDLNALGTTLKTLISG